MRVRKPASGGHARPSHKARPATPQRCGDSPWWSLGKSTCEEASLCRDLGQKPTQGKFLLVTRSQWTSLLPSFCAKLLDLSQRNGQPSYKFSCCLSDTGQQFTGSGWPYDQGQPYLGGQTLWGAAACGPHLRTVPMH